MIVTCYLFFIPYFVFLNGWIQYFFDKKNLKAHNLNSMDITLLKQTVTELGLKNISVEYTRKPMIWLEPKDENMQLRKMVKLLSFMLKLFPIRCRLLSPFIMIYGESEHE